MSVDVDENKCSSGDNNLVKAYCQQCKKYICTACHVSYHLDHDSQVTDLADKATRFLAQYQNLARAVKLISDRRKVYIEDIPILKRVDAIKSKINETKNMIEKDIDKTLDSISSYISNSPLIKILIKKKNELEGDLYDALKETKDELENICGNLLHQMIESKYESACKILSPELLNDYKVKVDKLVQSTSEDVKDIEELEKLKRTTVQYAYDPMKIFGMIQVDSPITKPERIFLFNREQNVIMFYNITTGKAVSTKLSQKFILPYRFVSVDAMNNVYLIGGDNNHGFYIKSIYLYDEIRQMLIPLANMSVPRSRHSVARLLESLIVTGGENRKGALSACEKYDIKKNTWKYLPSLEISRCNHSSCSLNNWIYVGFGWNKTYLNSIERLDTQNTDKWEILNFKDKKSIIKLQTPGIIPITQNEILVFGGQKEDGSCNNSFILNVEECTSTQAKDIPKPELFISSEIRIVSGTIYCFGYQKGDLYKYEIMKDSWEVIEQDKIPI